jgi:hypothetical protein
MDHPFIDAKELTNEQLQQRIQKCQTLLYAEMMGGHTGMVDSIRQSLEVYEQEFSERVFLQRQEEFAKKNPDETIEIGTIQEIEETDPNATVEIPVKRQKDL